MLLLKCLVGFHVMMLGAAFAKGVVLGGAGATVTAVAVVGAATAARRCCGDRDERWRRDPPAPAAA
jgi:hypothetical protein